MAFTGLSAKEGFNASLLQEDVSKLVRMLSPKETPILDWLGDGAFFATQIKHEYIEDYQLPNYIIASTAISSATAATAFQINGLGLALNYGQLLEIEASGGTEVMQINSIYGANSIGVTRNYDGAGSGSLAAGGQLYVRAAVGVEGADHNGNDTRRLGTRSANTVGLFRMELSESKTVTAANLYGANSWEMRKAKALTDIMHQLEKEVVRGKWNTTNSLGTATGADRTFQGIRNKISTVNSTIVSASFVANPHLYLGNVMLQIFQNGASPSEEWGIIAGPTWFKAISDLNDTRVQDSNTSELFQRVIRTYKGPFGQAELFLSRVLQGGPSGSPGAELLIIPRNRVQVGPLQGRSFSIDEMSQTGDNRKALVIGEYTLEHYHEAGTARAIGS